MILNLTEILTNLYQLPQKFEVERNAGRWHAAAMSYEKAVMVSRFIEMDAEARDKLLSRFNDAEVEEVYKKAGWYEEGAHAGRIGNRKKAV